MSKIKNKKKREKFDVISNVIIILFALLNLFHYIGYSQVHLKTARML